MDDRMTPRVGVALVNWNGLEFTIPCIQSLLSSDYPQCEVVVVDNGSSDGSQEIIAQMFPGVVLLRNSTNRGFAAATNQAIKYLQAQGVELIWILNNDTIVHRSCLTNLTNALQHHPEMAAATTKILYETPSDQIWYAGAKWRSFSLTAPHRGEGERDKGQYDQECEVDFVSGCSMFVRAEAFDTVGLLDERYFAYYEDTDWCLRARQARLKFLYEPACVIWHRVSATVRKNTLGSNSGTASPIAYYLTTRNRIFLIRRHALRPWQFSSALLALLVPRLALSLGQVLLGRREKAVAIWRGTRDGLATPL